jgi:hypothetical protein
MAAAYAAIVRAPGVLRVFVPSLLGRMSFATVTLGCVVLVAHATGSYAAAGLASGAFGLANVIAAPFRARFGGQRGFGSRLGHYRPRLGQLHPRMGLRRGLAPRGIAHHRRHHRDGQPILRRPRWPRMGTPGSSCPPGNRPALPTLNELPLIHEQGLRGGGTSRAGRRARARGGRRLPAPCRSPRTRVTSTGARLAR